MEKADFNEAVAKAYYRAALAGANMRAAAAALESIRERITGNAGYQKVMEMLDDQIGQADLTQLAGALCELRAVYSPIGMQQEAGKIRREFDAGTAPGWTSWLNAYAGLFQETAWRTELGHLMAREALPSTPSSEWPVDRVQHATWLVWRDHWPEAYDWLLFVAGQATVKPLKARLYAIGAEIQIYRFGRPNQAEALLRRADEISPGEHLPSRVWAEFWLSREKVDRAKELYQQMVERRPRLADGYLGLAQCADREGDLDAAESYYLQAVDCAPGMSSAHRQLMGWYAKRMDERESLVMSTYRRFSAVSGDDADGWVELGVLYNRSKKFDQAREWLKRADGDTPDNALAAIWLGYVDLDESATDSARAEALQASAEQYFRKTIGLLPEALDGYWGMLELCRQQKKWDDARQWCTRGLECHPEWRPVLLQRRASLSLELNDWDAAEKDLRAALELEPDHQPSIDDVSALANKLHAAGDDPRARVVLALWREHKGGSIEHLYQNRLGNWRYEAGEYAEAAVHYRAAAERGADDPVLHSNLALALEKLRGTAEWHARTEEAIRALTDAVRLDPNNTAYLARLDRLTKEQEFEQLYGQAAMSLQPFIYSVRIEVADPVLPEILDDKQVNLSSQSLDQVEAWRRDFRARFGVVMPGLRFGVYGSPPKERSFRIQLFGQSVPDGEREAAKPGALESMLRLVEQLCTPRLADFMGHQEAANLLRDVNSEEAKKILQDGAALTQFVLLLRSLLLRNLPIVRIEELTKEYWAQRSTGKDAETITTRLCELAMAATPGD